MAKAAAKKAGGKAGDVGAMPPHWLDSVIDKALKRGANATAIATAVASGTRFMAAIRRGLKNKPEPGMMAPSYAQTIREEIRREIEQPD